MESVVLTPHLHSGSCKVANSPGAVEATVTALIVTDLSECLKIFTLSVFLLLPMNKHGLPFYTVKRLTLSRCSEYKVWGHHPGMAEPPD